MLSDLKNHFAAENGGAVEQQQHDREVKEGPEKFLNEVEVENIYTGGFLAECLPCSGTLPLISQKKLYPMLPEVPYGETGTMAMLVSVASVYLGVPRAPAGIRPKLSPSLLHPVQIRAHCSGAHYKAQHKWSGQNTFKRHIQHNECCTLDKDCKLETTANRQTAKTCLTLLASHTLQASLIQTRNRASSPCTS